MDIAIREIIDALGGPGKAAKAAAAKGLLLKRQTIEYWHDEQRFPAWRSSDVMVLAALAAPLLKPKRRQRATA